jgi:hypothetical protein
MTAPACATDVQRHRRHFVDQHDLENDRRAGDPIDICWRDRALATRHAAELVLHVCCTPVDLINIGGRL